MGGSTVITLVITFDTLIKTGSMSAFILEMSVGLKYMTPW